jgi:GT2 family glycosyltransferase
MRANGINAIRTYTTPPRWLLDLAHEQGLRVLVGVGLAGEQLVAFLDDRRLVREVRERCTSDVRACASHPGILGYAIGNEIPSPIVRWHGRARVERFLAELYDLAKQQDPGALVTYVNYPTTEYLQIPFLDFHSFNVYLESNAHLIAYLARLQNLAGDKPLVMAEIGLDGLRNGVRAQARSIEAQIGAAFAAGCAGTFVFSWTDDWHTGGTQIDNWRFGLTDVERNPKPALSRVRRKFAQIPIVVRPEFPRVSVIVCTYNGARTIRQCLDALAGLQYPNYEVIVVDDGSTDLTAEIVAESGVRLISTDNRGLSSARNIGLRAATGEIVAYVDDDAYPDPHWLSYLVHTFRSTDHAGVGGPNLLPPDDGLVARCVAHSPGGPTHVLLTDQVAEHIPGCNMAFRAKRLREVGAFDRQFRIAGDDVDVCWRLQQSGYTLGFHPAAVVWHHRRGSVRGYLRQQLNYGRAEAMLEAKWPEKYNAIGHVSWRGRLYGVGAGIGFWRSRVYHGVWASQPFQSLYTPSTALAAIPLMPEWFLMVAALGGVATLAPSWRPLLGALPLALIAMAISVTQAVRAAGKAVGTSYGRNDARRRDRARFVALTAALHLLQPLVRLWGRLSYGLTPWRRRRRRRLPFLSLSPLPRCDTAWSETWEAAEQRLAAVEQAIRCQVIPQRRGGDFDDWDLEVRDGVLATARTRMAIEQYPGGRQFIRFRTWPHFYAPVVLTTLAVATLAACAAAAGAPLAAGVLGAVTVLLVLRSLGDAVAAIDCLSDVLRSYCNQVQAVPRPGPAPAATPTAAVQPRPADEGLLADLEEVLEATPGRT